MSDRLKEIKNYRVQTAQATVDELKEFLGKATDLNVRVYILQNLADAEGKLEDIKTS